MTRTIKYDITVVGAGPAGVAAAIVLARHGVSVCLLNRADCQNSNSVPPRVDTLAPEAATAMRLPGLQNVLQICHAIECPGVVSHWVGDERIENDYLLSPFGTGWHVNRREFDDCLKAQAKSDSNIDYYQCQLKSCESDETGFCCFATDSKDSGSETCFSSRYLIDASGASSFVAAQLGCSRTIDSHNYAARAIVEVKSAVADFRLWLERTSNGWFYLVPYDSHRLQISFVGDASFFGRDWSRRLVRECELIRFLPVPVNIQAAKWYCCSANSSAFTSIVTQRFLAVGDAAATINPLTGQGMMFAFQSGVDGANAVLNHFAGRTRSILDYQDAIQSRYKACLKQLAEFMTPR